MGIPVWLALVSGVWAWYLRKAGRPWWLCWRLQELPAVLWTVLAVLSGDRRAARLLRLRLMPRAEASESAAALRAGESRARWAAARESLRCQCRSLRDYAVTLQARRAHRDHVHFLAATSGARKVPGGWIAAHEAHSRHLFAQRDVDRAATAISQSVDDISRSVTEMQRQVTAAFSVPAHSIAFSPLDNSISLSPGSLEGSSRRARDLGGCCPDCGRVRVAGWPVPLCPPCLERRRLTAGVSPAALLDMLAELGSPEFPGPGAQLTWEKITGAGSGERLLSPGQHPFAPGSFTSGHYFTDEGRRPW